jgi:hypothetical protein
MVGLVMRIVIPLLIAVGATSFALPAQAQEQAQDQAQQQAQVQTAAPAAAPANLSAAVTNPVPPSPGNAAPQRQSAAPVASGTARTIDLAGLRTTPPRIAPEPEPAPASLLRGTALVPEASLQVRLEGSLRTAIRDVPREVLRPSLRLQGLGPRIPFEAPDLHADATESADVAAASAFEELN